MKEYNHKLIEKKWQRVWEKKKIFSAHDDFGQKKFYGLIEFPYPSGDGLHVGHVRGDMAMDIICRKRRMEGFNVLYPIGWDAFGLPTENYAIKTGIHPSVVTKKNSDNFRRQLKLLGLSFDWSREINTTDSRYYKWTQWIFLQLLKHGLAYKKKMPINWCPSCKIGLANEEVVGGCCERCGTPVEKRDKEQWMLAITKYADRLDKDLDNVDFLEKIKIQQRNWIGKSEGSEIEFKLVASSSQLTAIKVFTTRPDTLFGATYLVVAPEHPLIESLKSKIENWDETIRYIVQSKKKTEMERTETGKEKTGVELKGVKAINPANGEEIPVWIADYVLAEYGTGAIMAVPAHDERDFEFATRHNLPVKEVVTAQTDADNHADKRGKINKAYTSNGLLINSGKFDGMNSEEAKWAVTEAVGGKRITKFKLRDWIFSRQHYWGEPIPVIHCARCANRKYNFIFIHGYNSSCKVGWKPWLKKELEKKGHTVFAPELPNADKPKVDEQADFILKNAKIDKDTILISHSLGGAVMMRVLEKLKGKVAKAVFVDSVLRPKFNDKERPDVVASCDWKFDFTKVKQAAREFVVLADENLPIIPKDQTLELGKMLDAPVLFVQPNGRHFGKAETEPEILKLFENSGWVPVPEKDLPVELPKVEKYQPTDTGESPLAAIKSFVDTRCPQCGGPARRETDTMPNWAGSSWYYLRYIDPKNNREFVGRNKLNYWSGISEKLRAKSYKLQAGPVDWYNGGMEHTTLHLLYSRFWHKFLYDIGVVPTSEPYAKRTSHGLILAEGGVKMSKSKGNVINPDDLVERFGADALRVYEMFMGPFDQAIAWSTDGLVGARRFIEKVWRVGAKLDTNTRMSANDANNSPPTADSLQLEAVLHRTIKKVSEDIEQMKFNTAISSLMICANEMDSASEVPRELFEMYIKILSPFAPHIAEELWSELGHPPSRGRYGRVGKTLIAAENWPVYDPAKIADEMVTIIAQVNGKVRGQFSAAPNIAESEAIEKAKSLPEVKKWINGKQIKKAIFVKGRLVNFVV
jgi:leucyl-tRNA synthetase/predicted alpha/beta hydrolase family esterase